jgi:hypothetical protein
MSAPKDLSALRIDRSPAPGGNGRRPVFLVLASVVLALAVVFGWLRFAPQAVKVQVGLAEATGGGSATGGGISANG